MKISAIFLAGLASADENNITPRQQLNRLVQFAEEILDSGNFDHMPERFINRWKTKFANNGGRMGHNFQLRNQRCGFDDENM